MSRQDWREVDRQARRGGSRLFIYSVVAIIAIGLIAGGIWYFNVATSDIKGKGDATRKINAADNRIFAQEDFEKRHQDILASDRKLDQLAKDKADNPNDNDARVRYTGAVTYCQAIIGEYNAKARSVSAEKFRAEDLPFEIDQSDPRYDCKESTAQ